MTGRRQHLVLCGCGRAVRLRRQQAAAPILSLLIIPILIAVITAGPPPTAIATILVMTILTVAHHLRIAFLVAELTGTGFCPTCTCRA